MPLSSESRMPRMPLPPFGEVIDTRYAMPICIGRALVDNLQSPVLQQRVIDDSRTIVPGSIFTERGSGSIFDIPNQLIKD